MTGNTSSTMVALPTRKHRLPLDARNKIAETFTGKLVNLYTWSDGLPKNISTHIPVEIDWSDVCESLVGINCFPTAIEVIEPVCDAISTVLNEIIDRLRSKTTGPESWAQKFEAAKIREIRIGVISGEDVDVFVKQNVLHVELPKRYSTESIKVEKEWVKNVDQLKLPALWDRLFDIDETAEIERGERLPDASSLPKPEELLMCTAPYFISIHAHNDATVSGAVSIFIEGSHKPTLNLIYDYFRNNPQTSSTGSVDWYYSPNIPGGACIKITDSTSYIQYSFCVGMPTLLNFVEGVCGYKLVPDMNMYNSHAQCLLRRDKPFLPS